MDLQYLYAFEEMGELVQALSKYLRKKTKHKIDEQEKLIDNIAEEICDVQLCLDQLKLHFDCWDRVREYQDFKIKRANERVKKHDSELQMEKPKLTHKPKTS